MKVTSFDESKIGKYTVIRVRIFFPNDPDIKYFVVLKKLPSAKRPQCKCIKITSNTALYENRPDMLASCVLYEQGEIQFLKKKSVIEPQNRHNISYEHFEKYAQLGEFSVEGEMPVDFHAKLVAAITNSILLNPNEKNELLETIGEPPISHPA